MILLYFVFKCVVISIVYSQTVDLEENTSNYAEYNNIPLTFDFSRKIHSLLEKFIDNYSFVLKSSDSFEYNNKTYTGLGLYLSATDIHGERMAEQEREVCNVKSIIVDETSNEIKNINKVDENCSKAVLKFINDRIIYKKVQLYANIATQIPEYAAKYPQLLSKLQEASKEINWIYDDGSIMLKLGDIPVVKGQILCDIIGIPTYPKDDCHLIKSYISELLYAMPYYVKNRESVNLFDQIYTRTQMIELLARKYQYKEYLEIGCDRNQTFHTMERLKFTKALCVDPNKGGTLRMTSDDYFKMNDLKLLKGDNSHDMFDLIFIDGLHEEHQAYIDVLNSLKYLKPGGTIVMHDLYPIAYEYQTYPMQTPMWNGDTWKAAVKLRLHHDIEIVVGDFDHGVGIIRRRDNQHRLPVEWERRLTRPPFSYLNTHKYVGVGNMMTNEVIDSTDEKMLREFLKEEAKHSLTYADLRDNANVLLRLKTVEEVAIWLGEE